MSALFVVLLSNTIFQCLLHSVWWCCENPEFHKNRSFIRKWKKIPPIRTRKLVFFYIHSFRLISGSQKFSIPFNFVQKMPKKETFTSRSFIRKWKKIPPIRTRKLVRVSSCGRCRRPRTHEPPTSYARAYEVGGRCRRPRKLVRVSSCGRCRRPRKLVRTSWLLYTPDAADDLTRLLIGGRAVTSQELPSVH